MLARDKNKNTIIEYEKPKNDNHIQFEEYNVKEGKESVSEEECDEDELENEDEESEVIEQ